ncbi:MAG TPA: hypothetical protein VII61_04000 [Ktedonobacteraceae bacterium]
MFSIFKKVSDQQEVVLQDLTEEQLTQAAGGQAKARDWDSHKKWIMKKQHHQHHHHHHSGSHMKWSNVHVVSKTPTGHW